MRGLAAGVLAVAVGAVAVLSAPPVRRSRTAEGPLLPRAEVLRVLGAPLRSLVADYYWILTLQQISAADTAEAARDVLPYADLTTSLDPRMMVAYTMPATAIPFPLGRERWVNTEESTRLVRKGLAVEPGNYRLRFQLAYNLAFFHQRYREAADVLKDLAREPQAPAYLSSLATRLYATGGDLESSLALATSLRDTAEDPETRAFYEQRVLTIHQEAVLRRLDAGLAAFRTREGRAPKDFGELARAGDIPGMPLDPLGGTFYLGPDGRARASSTNHRFELLHDTPERRREKQELEDRATWERGLPIPGGGGP